MFLKMNGVAMLYCTTDEYFLMLEMDEYPSMVLVVFLDAVIKFFDVALIQESQDLLLELSTTFSGNDLNKFDLSIDRFFHDAIKLRVDFLAAVVNIM